MSDSVIQVQTLVAGYDDLAVLDGVSFDVRRGEVFVVMGGSGCGKRHSQCVASLGLQ